MIQDQQNVSSKVGSIRKKVQQVSARGGPDVSFFVLWHTFVVYHGLFLVSCQRSLLFLLISSQALAKDDIESRIVEVGYVTDVDNTTFLKVPLVM